MTTGVICKFARAAHTRAEGAALARYITQTSASEIVDVFSINGGKGIDDLPLGARCEAFVDLAASLRAKVGRSSTGQERIAEHLIISFAPGVEVEPAKLKAFAIRLAKSSPVLRDRPIMCAAHRDAKHLAGERTHLHLVAAEMAYRGGSISTRPEGDLRALYQHVKNTAEAELGVSSEPFVHVARRDRRPASVGRIASAAAAIQRGEIGFDCHFDGGHHIGAAIKLSAPPEAWRDAALWWAKARIAGRDAAELVDELRAPGSVLDEILGLESRGDRVRAILKAIDRARGRAASMVDAAVATQAAGRSRGTGFGALAPKRSRAVGVTSPPVLLP